MAILTNKQTQDLHAVLASRLIAASGQKPGRLPELAIAVQIDTTLHPSETRVSHGFQRVDHSFNRTAVRYVQKELDMLKQGKRPPVAPLGLLDEYLAAARHPLDRRDATSSPSMSGSISSSCMPLNGDEKAILKRCRRHSTEANWRSPERYGLEPNRRPAAPTKARIDS